MSTGTACHMWPGLFLTNVGSSIQWTRHMKFGFNQPSGFWRDVWQCWQHTYIRTTEAYLYYKLTNEPKGSGELNKRRKDISFVILQPVLKCQQNLPPLQLRWIQEHQDWSACSRILLTHSYLLAEPQVIFGLSVVHTQFIFGWRFFLRR